MDFVIETHRLIMVSNLSVLLPELFCNILDYFLLWCHPACDSLLHSSTWICEPCLAPVYGITGFALYPQYPLHWELFIEWSIVWIENRLYLRLDGVHCLRAVD